MLRHVSEIVRSDERILIVGKKVPQLMSFQQYFEMVQKVRPSVMSLTDGDSQLENKTKHANEIGAKIKVVPLIPNISSTLIHKHATITSD